MFMNVNICMYVVQTRLPVYCFTTKLDFPSGQISFATPASLSSAQAPFLQSIYLGEVYSRSRYIPCIFHVYVRRRHMPGIYHVYTMDHIEIPFKFSCIYV